MIAGVADPLNATEQWYPRYLENNSQKAELGLCQTAYL
jgi:hypothetical protein